ncbi:MAG: hypothetical protein SFU83_02875 [Meiothermus sp.]|nr:hypothetical protein [Meiothermus sp.]
MGRWEGGMAATRAGANGGLPGLDVSDPGLRPPIPLIPDTA